MHDLDILWCDNLAIRTDVICVRRSETIRAVGRYRNPGDRTEVAMWWTIICPPPQLCVEMGFTWTFPRNQDAKVKLKCELISIKS